MVDLNDTQNDLCERAWEALKDAGFEATPRSMYDYNAQHSRRWDRGPKWRPEATTATE